MESLSPLEMDALTEILNIGVGKAASLLNDITNHHVTLKVLQLELLPIDELPKVTSKFGEKNISSIQQNFQGDFTGLATLIFPPESAIRLVSVITGEDIHSPGLNSLHSSALMEIGNIVLNAIMGSMCNFLKCELEFTLPEYHETKKVSNLTITVNPQKKDGVIILAEASFFIKKMEIHGFILIVFEIQDLRTLTKMIHRSLELKGSK